MVTIGHNSKQPPFTRGRSLFLVAGTTVTGPYLLSSNATLPDQLAVLPF